MEIQKKVGILENGKVRKIRKKDVDIQKRYEIQEKMEVLRMLPFWKFRKHMENCGRLNIQKRCRNVEKFWIVRKKWRFHKSMESQKNMGIF